LRKSCRWAEAADAVEGLPLASRYEAHFAAPGTGEGDDDADGAAAGEAVEDLLESGGEVGAGAGAATCAELGTWWSGLAPAGCRSTRTWCRILLGLLLSRLQSVWLLDWTLSRKGTVRPSRVRCLYKIFRMQGTINGGTNLESK